MSVVGVGVDVVGLERFGRVLERDAASGGALRRRLFDDDEAGLPVRSLAARFAAKEALAKALGAPPGLRWRDARVRTGEHGAPSLELSGTVAARAAVLGVGAVHVSLSHDAGVATAFVVLERSEGVPRPTWPSSPPSPGPAGPSHPDPTHPTSPSVPSRTGPPRPEELP